MLCFETLAKALHREAQRSRLAVKRRDQLLYFPEKFFVVGINDKRIDIRRGDK
ncbi:hypothetical protein MASR1M12_11530 [Erysipelotrichia bacterium]